MYLDKKNKMSFFMRYCLFLACLFLLSCEAQVKKSTPSSGYIQVAVDESFRPLMDTATDVFMGLYRKAQVSITYRSEDNAVKDLLKDTVRMVVISRKLTAGEEAELKKQDAKVTTVKIAVDAVALITHPQSSDTALTVKRFGDIVRGKVKNKNGEPIILVFDNNFSSNLNYIRDYFKLTPQDSIKIFATKSNKEVIDYVAQNENAIGVIGVNWVSDIDNTANQVFLEKVRVIPLATKDEPTSPDDYYMPDQYSLHEELYPFRRDVYAISREIGSGLASGFITFLRGEKGQRIVQKEALLPAQMQIRFVEVKK
jgi:phosphate transport system substrate-binding protein